MGMLQAKDNLDDAGNAETEDQSQWIQKTLELKKNLGTIEDFRKEMLASAPKKAATPTAVIKMAPRRKRDLLGGGTWHGSIPPLSAATDVPLKHRSGASSGNGHRALSPPRQAPVNSMDELKSLVTSNHNSKPATSASGKGDSGTEKNHRDHASSAPKSELSTSRHGRTRRKHDSSGLSSSLHVPTSKESSTTTREGHHHHHHHHRHDSLQTSRHGIPSRHKSSDGAIPSLPMEFRKETNDTTPASQQPHDDASRSTHSKTRSLSPKREKSHSTADPKGKEGGHSRSACHGGRRTSSRDAKRDPLRSSRHKPRQRHADEHGQSILAKSDAAEDDRDEHPPHGPRSRSRSSGGGRRGSKEAQQDTERPRDQSSSLGRRKTGVTTVTPSPSDEDDTMTEPDRQKLRSSNGERRRVPSRDGGGKRRALKGNKHEFLMQQEDGKITTPGTEHMAEGTDKGDQPLSEAEKQEMMMLDFSTMSFENEWDVRPKSMRPSVDPDKAKAIALKEAQEKEIRRRRKSKDRAKKKIESVTEE